MYLILALRNIMTSSKFRSSCYEITFTEMVARAFFIPKINFKHTHYNSNNLKNRARLYKRPLFRQK